MSSTSRIFRDADSIEGEEDKEWVSLLHLLCEYHKDSIVMFNCLENHPSMFTFKTLYHLVKDVISNGKPQQARILNSSTMKSYFTFLSHESQIKWIEEIIDWAEDEEMKTAVCVILCNPTYKESFENANGELYEEMKDKSIDLFSSTKGVTEHKESVEASEASEASDASEPSEASDKDENSSADEDQSENNDDDDDEENEGDDEDQSADEDEDENSEDVEDEENNSDESN